MQPPNFDRATWHGLPEGERMEGERMATVHRISGGGEWRNPHGEPYSHQVSMKQYETTSKFTEAWHPKMGNCSMAREAFCVSFWRPG